LRPANLTRDVEDPAREIEPFDLRVDQLAMRLVAPKPMNAQWRLITREEQPP
jgi:hypothetical protein